MFAIDFAGHILSFDQPAAQAHAEIAAPAAGPGDQSARRDAQIAVIARCRDAGVATRHIADFADCGIGLIDPLASVSLRGTHVW